MDVAPMTSRKRKLFPFDNLNQDLLERVLSRLPPSSFFRLRAVCRSWSSVASSATFRLACSEVQCRDPWFLMIGQHLDRPIVFDTSQGNWKELNRPNVLLQAHFSKSVPVATSGGLVCFRAPSGQFVVCNPLTCACREVPFPDQDSENKALHGVSMSSSGSSSHRIFLVMGEGEGEFPGLIVKIFDSEKNQWEDKLMLRKHSGSSSGDEHEPFYFLSKTGDVVAAANTQRSPSKQYSSVLTVEDGEEVLYFFSQSATVVACNLAQKTYSQLPKILPVNFEYSIDMIGCKGQMFVVVLSDFLETSSLRIWKYSKGLKSWQHVSAMPPSMSHDFYAKRADINCVGCGDSILICISSSEFSSCVVCNLADSEWIELPKCFANGRCIEFTSAFSFEPRIEVTVHS